MNPAEVIFRELCDAPRLEDAVKALEASQLCGLILWLRQQGTRSGVRSLVLGVAEHSATDRFIEAIIPF